MRTGLADADVLLTAMERGRARLTENVAWTGDGRHAAYRASRVVEEPRSCIDFGDIQEDGTARFR